MKFGFEHGGKHMEKPNKTGLCFTVTALTPTPSSLENPLKKIARKGSQQKKVAIIQIKM